MKLIILRLLLLIPFLTFAQSPAGYWDNQRITNKEIKLSSGEKIIVKSEDFPVGTTEFAYRITLLDENQKMVSDLASVLKAIPDPYYIGKGAGGAISLLSTVSGSDKCTYAIFTSETIASDFIGSENTEKACLFQKNPVSKDAKVVSIKSACLGEETKNIWFTFKNENWVMGEKIVLEIIPWVDNIASRGWSKKNKEIALKTIYSVGFNQYVAKSKHEIAYKTIELISKEYRFTDFQKLSIQEQKLVIEKNEEIAFSEVGLKNSYSDIYCYLASKLAKGGKIDEAIDLMNNKVISKADATAFHYNCLAELYIQSNQFEKALKTLESAQKLDPSELKVQMNLAHVYMFMDEVTKSKEIHKRYMNQNVSSKQTWKNKAINDLDTFKKSTLPQGNINKIWRLYN
ncbi:MAG: tetratricopeptide repeat protein [Bacteroidota bacterium]